MPSLIIEGVIACLLSLPPMASDMETYLDCREQYKKVKVVEQWIPILQTHFKPEDVLQASLIVYCESSGRPSVHNHNTNGTMDEGLFMFNDVTWTWLQDKLNFEGERKDPLLNIKIASWLFYNDGKGKHWYSSEHCWNYDF
tara:strand:+ start:5273 stop:5695 length:423 start_codon:yes stop_codon:yes gene_type:complete